MAKLFRKVVGRIRGSRSQADVSSYAEKYHTLNQSFQRRCTITFFGTGFHKVYELTNLLVRQTGLLQSPLDDEGDEINCQDEKLYSPNKFKTWTNRFRKTTRTNGNSTSHRGSQPTEERPPDIFTPTRLLSCNGSYQNLYPLVSPPMSPPPGSLLDDYLDDNTLKYSLSGSTAEIDSEFGFTMKRTRGKPGLHHGPPQLSLDMTRQNNAFAPFRPFSPSVVLPSYDSQVTDPSLPPRYFSISSLNRFTSLTSSLPPNVVPASSTSVFQNRFYSKSNLTLLGVNRAPTVESGISSALLDSSNGNIGHSTLSFRSSNTPRSFSAELLSLSSRKVSTKSTIASRNTTPSFALASPTSFC